MGNKAAKESGTFIKTKRAKLKAEAAIALRVDGKPVSKDRSDSRAATGEAKAALKETTPLKAMAETIPQAVPPAATSVTS